MDYLLVLALQSSFALAEARQWIGLVAAVLAAVLAAHASWHVTDRLMTLRQRPDED